MAYNLNIGGIKTWAEDDRPREKFFLKGKLALSDAELLAILIGMGTKEHSAVDLGKIILKSVDNDLFELSKLGIAELKKIKGIGTAKAISILAALELGRRRKDFAKAERTTIYTSNDSYEHFKPYMLDLLHEEFWMICLSRRLEIIKTVQLSIGGVSGTVIDPKIVFSKALEAKCNSIIVSHNHPSGTLKPSEEDIRITKQLSEGGKLLEIRLADHLIFTNNDYFSFADNGLL